MKISAMTFIAALGVAGLCSAADTADTAGTIPPPAVPLQPVPTSAAPVAPPASWPSASAPFAPTQAARPRQAPPPAAPESSHAATEASSTAEASKIISEDKWVFAGYNNDEIVYQVFVTSQDSRVVRCTTDVKGFYFDKGQKITVSDRQITTVFPNQPTQVGTWLDFDQKSGATYSVKCHPV